MYCKHLPHNKINRIIIYILTIYFMEQKYFSYFGKHLNDFQ